MFSKFRQPTATHKLHRRNIYIMPTRSGLVLLVTLNIMLIACINFQINLGYALTFLIGATAFASIFTCFRTLSHLHLSINQTRPVFAGTELMFTVSIDNPSTYARYGLGLAIDKRRLIPKQQNELVWADVCAKNASTVTLATSTISRGWIQIPQLVIQTTFPMGTFRSWSFWQPAIVALVYPTPEVDAPALPVNGSEEEGGFHTQHVRSGEEFDGVRPYQPGDPLKQIYWKKVMPNGELLSKQRNTLAGGKDLWLSLESTHLGYVEEQISRLTAWVMMAHEQGVQYGLKLGALTIAPAQDENHQLECLKALALYQLPQTPEAALEELARS